MEIVPPSDIGTDLGHNKTKQQTAPQSSSHHHHHHHHNHNHNPHLSHHYHNQTTKLPTTAPATTTTNISSSSITTIKPKQIKDGGGSILDSQAQSSMAYQHKHALHRLRRLKKKSPHRDLVISFVPRLRISIINRLDFFHRYSKQEQEVLSCFDFLDELVLNYCDGGLDSPRYSQKLYQTMIYELM